MRQSVYDGTKGGDVKISRTISCVSLSLLVSLFTSLPGLPADAPFALHAKNNRLTLSVEDADLVKVLSEIVDQTGIRVVIYGQLDKTISTRFSDLPLDEGLRRVVRDFNHVFIYDVGKGKKENPVIREVIIYAEGGEIQKDRETPTERISRSVITPQEGASPELEKASLESLVGALKNSNPDVREEAVDLLAELNDRRATPYLAEVLLKDVNEDVRASAADALGEIGSKEAIGSLTRALNDPEAYVRESVVDALADLEGKEAIGLLARALRDPDAEVRESAVDALADLGGEEVVDPLMVALRDEDEDVREAAEDALEELRRKGF